MQDYCFRNKYLMRLEPLGRPEFLHYVAEVQLQVPLGHRGRSSFGSVAHGTPFAIARSCQTNHGLFSTPNGRKFKLFNALKNLNFFFSKNDISTHPHIPTVQRIY
jgi:hypothetical protein